MKIRIPPLGKGESNSDVDQEVRLAKSLKEATGQFMRKDSVAREVFGNEFVEHFGGTREHEIRLWDEAVTDWLVSFSHRFPCLHEVLKTNSITRNFFNIFLWLTGK